MRCLRRRRKAERPSEIIEAAFDEFATRGFAGTRLDDVAKRAGITKGTIYVYFPSKEDLFLAALKEKARPVFENLAALTAEPKGSAADILRAHLDFSAAHMVSDTRGREIVRVLMSEGSRCPEIVDRWHADVIQPALDSIRNVIRYGIERGEFHRSTAEDFPQLILAPAMLAINWLTIFGERQPFAIDGFFRAAVDLFMHGLCVPNAAADAAASSEPVLQPRRTVRKA